MNERDLWWKITIVGAATAIAFASIWPMNEKLKYGIDLQGGYSLLYEIDDTGIHEMDRATLAERVMRVLRDRVDPQGVYNLVWRPVGHNRLEIQMPRPSETIMAARRKIDAAQEKIQSTHLRRTEILRAVSVTEGRDAALAAVEKGVESRRPLLQAAASTYDVMVQTQAAYDARLEQIRNDNLTDQDVRRAVEKPAAERAAAFAELIRGVPARQQLLEEAARAYDEMKVAAAATQPASQPAPPVVATQPADAQATYSVKLAAYEASIRKVLGANVDPNSLTDGVTINTVVAAEDSFDRAVGAVLATNFDITQLLTAADAKPGPDREKKVGELVAAHSELADAIRAVVDESDKLKAKRQGEGRLEDPADLQRLLRGAGVLEFRILAERDPSDPDKFDSYVETLKNRGPRPRPGEENFQWFAIQDPKNFLKGIDNLEQEFDARKQSLPGGIVVERYGDKFYVLAHIADDMTLAKKTGTDEWSLKGARVDHDEEGFPCIAFELDERGGSIFDSLTRRNIQRQLSIFLDDECISHATIQSAIRTSGRITGKFQREEVVEMVKKLDAGSLPRKLKDPPISVKAIGPSLGEANRAAGLTSAKWGAVVVVVFLIGLYFYAGGVALIAVALNMLMTLAMMAWLGATLTLPGIAGFVLALGMAVDANVLINERMREELAKGTALRMAIKLGYDRAFAAILDSNLTTILTCAILYLLGSEEIKGFGLTLGLGVLINLFTAYYVTRMFFEFMSMLKIPMEVARYPVVTAVIVSASGAALYGLGYWINDPDARQHSVLINFGLAILYCGPAILGTSLLMYVIRLVHANFQVQGKSRIPMMRTIPVMNIDWYAKRKMFFGLSGLAMVVGGVLFFSMDKNKLYDIEFLGGVSAQVDLKEGSTIDQTGIAERLNHAGEKLRTYAKSIREKAGVTGSASVWTLSTPGVPAQRLEPVVRSVMEDDLSQVGAIQYSDPAAESMTVQTNAEAGYDLERMKRRLTDLAARFELAADSIASSQVQSIQAVGAAQGGGESFDVVTRENNKEIVVAALVDELRDHMDIQPALTFKFVRDAGGNSYFPIKSEKVAEVGLPLKPEEVPAVDLSGWRSGVAILIDSIEPPQTLDALRGRLKAMRLQPGFERYGWRESETIGLSAVDPARGLYSRVLLLVADENYPIEQGAEPASTWIDGLANPEVQLAQAALERQKSLAQVTQFDNQVSDEAKLDAYIALILSWIGIVIYLWFRFGSFKWGLAAVVALVHDIVLVCGALAICHFVADTSIGEWLKITKFRVDLAMVAAILTLVGYSVNDKIVVFDRIRENRGRLTEITPKMVNDSINQTLSRTMVTGLTTLGVLAVMYWFGGEGIHGFNFAMLIGILIGTYSSLGIATQLLLVKRARPRMA